MEPFGWCFIGCGKIANRAMNDLSLYAKNSRLAAVYARNTERAEAFARRYGARAYSSAAEAIQAPGVRGVYVCTTNETHKEYSLLAIRHGKPVLCEKPSALNVSETREVLSEAHARSVYYMEGMWTRHQPVFAEALAWIRNGKIGAVRSLAATFAAPFPYDEKHRLYSPERGGGALLDIGVYTLALSRFVFEAMPQKISALGVKAPSGVESAMICGLKYPDGALARLFFSVSADEPNDARVVGETGYITLPHRFWKPERATLYQNGQPVRECAIAPMGEGLWREFEAAQADIEAGRMENALVTHAFTLSLMQLADDVRDCAQY